MGTEFETVSINNIIKDVHKWKKRKPVLCYRTMQIIKQAS